MTAESNETNQRKQVRLHVGGLPAKISERDIEDRFRSFGTVQKVDLIPHPFEEGACRGFAYVNMETSDAQLTKCMNVLNGCAWKGRKLHISLAKANKFRTLEDGRIVFIKNEEEEATGKKKKMPKKKRKLVRHAGDFSLVTDKNVDKRKGWRRGRYGRAIACIRIRRPNRQMLIIDPSHYKNNLEKLFGSVKPKPLSQLSWTITEIRNENDVNIVEDEEVYEEEENEKVIEQVDNNMEDDDIEQDVEVVIESEPEQSLEDVIQETNEPSIQENIVTEKEEEQNNLGIEMETEPVDEDPIIVNTVESQIESKSQDLVASMPVVPVVKPETKFEVNVNWSSLFAPTTGESTSLFGGKVSNTESSIKSGFSLNSLIEKSTKIKNVSMDELFKKPEIPAAAPVKPEEPQHQSTSSATEPAKKIHNYAHLFGDLNRITPTTAVRFGMHLSRKEDLLQEWRIERLELKEDFKKRLAEGKRRNRRGNNGSNGNNAHKSSV